MRYLNLVTVALAVTLAVVVPFGLAGVPYWLTLATAVTAAWAVTAPLAMKLYPNWKIGAPLIVTTAETWLTSLFLSYLLLR